MAAHKPRVSVVAIHCPFVCLAVRLTGDHRASVREADRNLEALRRVPDAGGLSLCIREMEDFEDRLSLLSLGAFVCLSCNEGWGCSDLVERRYEGVYGT